MQDDSLRQSHPLNVWSLQSQRWRFYGTLNKKRVLQNEELHLVTPIYLESSISWKHDSSNQPRRLWESPIAKTKVLMAEIIHVAMRMIITIS